MQFSQTPIVGAWLIEHEPIGDDRGFFSRTFCVREFEQHGLNAHLVQQSISWNKRSGTLRGLHYQAAPHEEDKLVRVTRGSIYDVIVDLRSDSPTLGQWFGIELLATSGRQLYIPKGVAHGFQTLCDDTEVFYQMTEVFQPQAARGIRWDDPQIGIVWPDHPCRIISSKDRALPFFSERS